MEIETHRKLESLGVQTPICQCCLSEDFDRYMVLAGRVLWCQHCNVNLRNLDWKEIDSHPKRLNNKASTV